MSKNDEMFYRMGRHAERLCLAAEGIVRELARLSDHVEGIKPLIEDAVTQPEPTHYGIREMACRIIMVEGMLHTDEADKVTCTSCLRQMANPTVTYHRCECENPKTKMQGGLFICETCGGTA